MQTHEEKMERQRELRKLNCNAYTKKYEKTKQGFLVRKYRNMQSRISGVQKQKHHLYRNLTLLDRNQFYEWALNSKVFHKLFLKWKQSNYDRKLCPSVNRIDTSRGYELDNIEWITHSENSRLGSISQKRKLKI